MLYRVLGHSKETGKRMSLELEANSRADAERQAARQQLNIIRIEPIGEAEAAPKEWTTLNPRKPRRVPWLLLILLLLAAAIAYFWPTLSQMLKSLPILNGPRGPQTAPQSPPSAP